MLVEMAYGRTGLPVELPDDVTTVVQPTYVPGLPDVAGALRNALRNPIGTPPLRRLVARHQTVAISVCDITRPMPSATVLPALLSELAHVPKHQITVLVATGTHRPNTPEELEAMLGPEVTGSYRVVNHDAFDPAQVSVAGETAGGIPVLLNRHWLDSDVRVTTGLVEPHLFAGFSGGPKMVAPGLAAFETIMGLHSAALLGHPGATWGVTDGNPVHEAILDAARQTRVDLAVDVTINRDHRLTSVYAGEPQAVHRAACHDARRAAMHAVEQPFEVVLTSNSGYPLDLNLYQAVKGMSAAAQIVREGGTIVCVSECSDGIPDHGEFKELLAARDSAEDLLEMICRPVHNRRDQWQVQLQAQILRRARVYLKSGYLSDDAVRAAHLEPVDDVSEAVMRCLDEYGQGARVCALPRGPQTIPYVERQAAGRAGG